MSGTLACAYQAMSHRATKIVSPQGARRVPFAKPGAARSGHRLAIISYSTSLGLGWFTRDRALS